MTDVPELPEYMRWDVREDYEYVDASGKLLPDQDAAKKSCAAYYRDSLGWKENHEGESVPLFQRNGKLIVSVEEASRLDTSKSVSREPFKRFFLFWTWREVQTEQEKWVGWKQVGTQVRGVSATPEGIRVAANSLLPEVQARVELRAAREHLKQFIGTYPPKSLDQDQENNA